MQKIDLDRGLALAIKGLETLPVSRLWATDPSLVSQVVSVAGMLSEERAVGTKEIAKAAGIFRLGDFETDDFVLVALWRKKVLRGMADITPSHPDQDLRGGYPNQEV